jgi:hypothetical protein
MKDEGVDLMKVMNVVEAFVTQIRADLQARWGAWAIDLTKPQYEVVGGLMARQITLAVQLARAPQVWNGHVAPLILRAMTDAYITLAWILEDAEKRCDLYIKFGLGQRKLCLEHFKAGLVARGEKDVENNEWVKEMTSRLNAERFAHLTEVSVASWSESDTRTMAEESGCLDLYRLAYTPFSAAVHSTWQHVADYNLERCSNALHQHHRVPVDPELDGDVDYVYRAAKYVDKTFDLFDRKTGVSIEASAALDSLVQALIQLSWTVTPDPLEDRAFEGPIENG